MNFGNLKETNLTALLPRGIKNSLVCYALINSEVVPEASDVITCHTNGCMYEIKNKKILRSLNVNETAVSVSCYYLLENEKIVLFYLILTSGSKLIIIRSTKNLKIVKDYERVKDIKVDDFQCLGFPQIKLIFLNDGGSLICKFPVEPDGETGSSEVENSGIVPDSLVDELQILNIHIDDLTEEYNQMRKICCKNAATDSEMIFVDSVTFSLPLDRTVKPKLMCHSKWLKVFGNSLILGMKVSNIGNEIIHDIEVTINHKEIKDYAYSFFQSLNDFSDYLFSSQTITRYIKPGEEIYAVVTFQVPMFFAESEFVVPFYVTCSDLPKCLLEESFVVSIQDIASRTIVGLEERFTVEDLMALKVEKSETRFKIRTAALQEGSVECMLTKNLGFKRIQHVKDKLFYCTSTYLKEVFVAVRHIAVNPSVWKLIIFPSERSQLYFLVNGLYDLLPERATILYDND